MDELLDASPHLPTAVFAHNDLMAIGALASLRNRGIRVPEDVSLVGYNNLPTTAYLTPPLTTVRYQSFEVGRLAGKAIMALLAGEAPANVLLEPRLVSRGSTRRVR